MPAHTCHANSANCLVQDAAPPEIRLDGVDDRTCSCARPQSIGGRRLRPLTWVSGLYAPLSQLSQVSRPCADSPGSREQVPKRVKVVGEGECDFVQGQRRLNCLLRSLLREPARMPSCDTFVSK